MEQLQEHSHRRLNILTNEWVLVSPHRTKRPWQGKQEISAPILTEKHNAQCYLCPGNVRANDSKNPSYTGVYVFDNDFAALNSLGSQQKFSVGLLKAEGEQGICRVICFSPDHSKSLANMSVLEIANVVSVWKSQYLELANLEQINYVQIFENKGDVMGCSNPHPHGQIWSQTSIPNEVQKKDLAQKEYFNKNKQSLVSAYINQELELDKRVLFENEHFVIVVPFWAVWPYETMICPKKHVQHLGLLHTPEEHAFAEAVSKITKAYDRLFNISFPYSSGIHQAPTGNDDYSHWHFHMSFYPPLLRSASVKKFMVGYEMFGMPQRDLTAEYVAEQLKKLI